jgi:hypothetical protein
MVFFKIDPDDDDSLDDALDKVRETITPDLIEKEIRKVIVFSWANLPREQRNVDDLDRRVRRAVDRVLRTARENSNQLGAKWWTTFM